MPDEGKKSDSQALGRAAIVAAVLIPLAQLLAPVVSGTYNTWLQARVSQEVEDRKAKVEVTRILLENYIGKSPEQQAATVDFLAATFPEYLERSRSILQSQTSAPEVREKVTQALATLGNVAPPTRETVAENERAGFQLLLLGNLAEARSKFGEAYHDFPTYHNVDEMYNRVLSAEVVQRYASATPDQKSAIQKDVLQRLNSTYGWGIPANIRSQIAEKLKSLN